MKKCIKWLWIPMLACILCSVQCRKKNTETPKTELEKLPPITQTGANTFGCLVDGVAWLPNGKKPDGWLGKPNLEVFINLNIGYRSFGINAGQYNGLRSYISFGTTKNLQIGEHKFEYINIDNENSFDYNKHNQDGTSIEYSIPYESLTYRKGKFIITKYDNIIAGIFELELCKNNSTDTVKITNGRFDLKL